MTIALELETSDLDFVTGETTTLLYQQRQRQNSECLFRLVIHIFVKTLASVAHYNRGATVDKAVVKKNLGRLTRACSLSFTADLSDNRCRPLPQGGARETTCLPKRWSISPP